VLQPLWEASSPSEWESLCEEVRLAKREYLDGCRDDRKQAPSHMDDTGTSKLGFRMKGCHV
jgi:hypothetical protein